MSLFSFLKPEIQHLDYNNLILEIEKELFKNHNFELKIIYSDKKHSSGRIKSNCIELRISKNISKKLQYEHIKNLVEKLSLKIEKNPNVAYQKDKIEYFLKAIEQSFFYLNKEKINIIKNSTKTIIKKENLNEKNEIVISIPNKNYSILNKKEIEHIEKKTAKLLCLIFQNKLQTLVYELNNKTLQSQLKDISFNYVTSKWGHCTGKNDIMLHIALLNTPKWVFEYVILHELAHTIHKNHSSKFWELCHSLTPHTKASKIYLKQTPPIIWELEQVDY